MIKERALVVIHQDGHIEVFATPRSVVKIVTMPECEGEEATFEDALWKSLKPFWQEVYWPVNMRASENIRKLTPEMMREGKACQQFIDDLNTIKEDHAKSQQETPETD